MKLPRLNMLTFKKTHEDSSLFINKDDSSPSFLQITAELLVLFGVIILFVTGFLWWHYIQSNPQRVFWGMIDNALQTGSLNSHVIQTNNTQTQEEYIHINTYGRKVADAITTYSPSPNIKVVTERLGTPDDDYSKYISVTTDQKSADGKPLNFSSVLNVWGKNANPTNKESAGILYGQAALDVIPFANLSHSQRADILKLMKKAYVVTYPPLSKETINNRPVYKYVVSVNPVAYVTMLKSFSKYTGLKQFANIDPAKYSQYHPFSFQASIDVWARQIKEIDFPNNAKIEQFSGFGVQTTISDVPKKTISLTDLEQKIQSIH
ncbi:MAG: hypothetical protein NVSMB46_07270 [Candidatus Saccharimonadales bacterium]